MSTSQSSMPKQLSATFDRGPAKYFHGREDVFEKFDELAKDSKKVNGGSTFIIQGPPGVGKTALLYECEKRAEKDGWHIAKIKSGALWNKEKMFRALGFWSLPQLKELSLEISLPQLVKGGISISKPVREETSIGLVEKRKKPLLLILDEAQHLASASDHPVERFEDARDLLDTIHNGGMGKPVILLAAGLGGTEAAFGKLGISRMSKRCFIALKPLEKDDEHAVIRDFLVKDGGVKGDPSAWIEAIASKTYGWPEHIISYGDAAAKLLQKNNGNMTPELLDRVFEIGGISREDYYQHRAKGLLKEHRVCLAKTVECVPLGNPVDHNLIKTSLRKEFGASEEERLFNLIQQKGILDERYGEYFIPIPSMHTWLVKNYAIERVQNVQLADKHGLDSPPKTLGVSRETIDTQLTPRDIRVEEDVSASSKEQDKNLTDQSSGWDR